MYEYIFLMTIFSVIPSLVLLYIFRAKIKYKNLLISLFVLFILGIVWDQISVRMGIWQFSSDKTIGNIFGIPLEEYLFMIFVPLLVITIYILVN
jgi:lycopene cyclase domain-containing protein